MTIVLSPAHPRGSRYQYVDHYLYQNDMKKLLKWHVKGYLNDTKISLTTNIIIVISNTSNIKHIYLNIKLYEDM